MRRLLPNLLTALSLLLCVAMVVLWVRGRFAQDMINHSAVTVTSAGFRSSSFNFTTWEGVVRVGASRHDVEKGALPAPDFEQELEMARSQERDARRRQWRSRSPEPFPLVARHPLSRWGFTWQPLNSHRGGHRVIGFGASATWWFVLLLCSMPLDPRVLSHLRRRRRRRRHLRPRCGYDLRATPRRCPECGTASSAHS